MSLLLLIVAVVLPSASAVKVLAGIPQDTMLNAGTTVIFEGGHNAKGDGLLELALKFRVGPVIHVFKLFKHPGERLQLVLSGMLKKNQGVFPRDWP